MDPSNNNNIAEILPCFQPPLLLPGNNNLIDSRQSDMKAAAQTCLPFDFHHLDQIHMEDSTSPLMFHAQASSCNFNQSPDLQMYPFTNNNYPPPMNSNLDFYECKSSFEGNYMSSGHGHGLVMDSSNYQLRSTYNYQVDIIKPLSFVVPDEVGSSNHNVLDRNNYFSQMTKKTFKATPSPLSIRRTCKNRKKSEVVKGQWSSHEDRYASLMERKEKKKLFLILNHALI